ncbi:hypothetical protein Lal_00025481 [Lupinus albus]|nr:hypothetical protein Lal_00025481 [Lupinus albus]
MLPPTIKGKARRREGDAAGEGKEKAFGDLSFFFHRKRRRPRMAYGACYMKERRFFDRGDCLAVSSFHSHRRPIRALPALSISARESAGNNRKEGVHVAAASAPFLVNGAAENFDSPGQLALLGGQLCDNTTERVALLGGQLCDKTTEKAALSFNMLWSQRPYEIVMSFTRSKKTRARLGIGRLAAI